MDFSYVILFQITEDEIQVWRDSIDSRLLGNAPICEYKKYYNFSRIYYFSMNDNIIPYYYLDSSDIIWYIFLYRKILHTNQSYSKYIFPSFETISFHLRFRAKFQNQSWPGESSSAHIYIKCINKQVPSMVCWPLMFPKYLPLRRNIVHLHPRHGSSPSSPRPVRMFAHQDPASAI